MPELSHAERSKLASRPCAAGDMTFGGYCLNCGFGKPNPADAYRRYQLYGGTARDNVTRPYWPYVYALSYHTIHDIDRRNKGITSPDSVFYFRRVEDRLAYRIIFKDAGGLDFKEWTVTDAS